MVGLQWKQDSSQACVIFSTSWTNVPPSYLRHRSDMRTEVAGNGGHVSLYRRHACEVDSSSTSQAYRR